MLQAEPDLIQSTRVLPKSAVHSSCSRDVLLKIGRDLDRKPARQSSLPIHKFPFTASLLVFATPNKNAVNVVMDLIELVYEKHTRSVCLPQCTQERAFGEKVETVKAISNLTPSIAELLALSLQKQSL